MTVADGELDSTRPDGKECATKVPYLPNPQPWMRGCPGNAEFFTANPECYRDRGFFSYGQFWQAHQPIISQKPMLKTVSSSFWPFGQRITCLTGSERKADLYSLDSRLIARAAPGIPRSRSMPMQNLKPAYPRPKDRPLNEAELGIKANEKRELGPVLDKRFQEVDFQAADEDTSPDQIIQGNTGARGEFHRVEDMFKRPSGIDQVEELFKLKAALQGTSPAGRNSFSAQSSRSRSSTASRRNLYSR